ncbi:PEBP-like protein [Rickenella mellea]|uniref:PEBP-like protein n=1 Tax=Rickenella mellea TaxID=50990 RepID=A0A4Y7Q6K2_9AGAM|nr:PEBP-like protein [Rickenella mellea]
MRLLTILTTSVILGLVYAQDVSLTQVRQAFQAARIPTDASVVFNPSVLLEVAFPQATGPDVRVKAGVQLPRNKTAIPPTFSIVVNGPGRRPRGEFVVAMVDLDAPTPQTPTSAQIRHFLGGNFTPLRDRGGLALLSNSTPAVSGFLQPTPPAGSDPHRYVFLLFQQSKAFNGQTFVGPTTSVAKFNISLFAQEVGLGNPLGGTFIRVGPDSPAA